MSDDEIIAVVTAHKEGKKIQVRSKLPGHHDWNDCANDPGWAFDNLDYRVAPEPQAIYCEASVSQKRAEKAADEDGFTFPDEQRSGFIYGYKKCLIDFGATIVSEPRKPREWKIPIDENGGISFLTTEPVTLVRVREVLDD